MHSSVLGGRHLVLSAELADEDLHQLLTKPRTGVRTVSIDAAPVVSDDELQPFCSGLRLNANFTVLSVLKSMLESVRDEFACGECGHVIGTMRELKSKLAEEVMRRARRNQTSTAPTDG